MFVGEVRSIFHGAVNQAQTGEAQLPKVNITNADSETEILYTGGRSRESLTTSDFSKFQSEDEVISRLIVLKNKGTTLNDVEKSKESKEETLRNYLSVKMILYYTELQQKEHSQFYRKKIGAISFYRITREYGLP